MLYSHKNLNKKPLVGYYMLVIGIIAICYKFDILVHSVLYFFMVRFLRQFHEGVKACETSFQARVLKVLIEELILL